MSMCAGLRKSLRVTWIALVAWGCWVASGSAVAVEVGPFTQHVHVAFTTSDGLPADDVLRVAGGRDGTLYAETPAGLARFGDGQWVPLVKEADRAAARAALAAASADKESLRLPAEVTDVRAVAAREGETAVAAREGLYLRTDGSWRLALPQMGAVRWAPVDVRAAVYDADGQLWFAAPQGVGVRHDDGTWQLFTGAEGLPYNDFTCAAAGPDGVWFGTSNGAVLFRRGEWHFRQGRRWLLDNSVRSVHVDAQGRAWFATPAGVSRIDSQVTTLAAKAAFYEDAIEKRHRRTRFGYVNPAVLAAPGDLTTARPDYSDNDGFNTGLYLAAMSHAYAVTNDARHRESAEKAFAALCFLGEVTQGGPHPAPPGFVARNVVPVTEPDPNQIYDLEYDRRRKRADSMWKIIQPRLPVDATGEWYWKCDSSSDELDGHFFGYATYFDRVCSTEEQREPVRQVVRRIVDHLLKHDYSLVDHDGTPTRWARFSPDELNRQAAWCDERGLNSYSMLTYLIIAHHITGDQAYRDVYEQLAFDEGYGMNGMTQPKALPGPRSAGHQPDDNMAFLNYYHLIRYESDPRLLSMYRYAITQHWQYEKFERNPFANFIYAACCAGEVRRDQWGETDLSPPPSCYDDAVETLRRYPLDLIEWPMSNAHRTDLMLLGDPPGVKARGGRFDGYAFQVDERPETYWDWDPWQLTSESTGTRVRPGFHYLLAYYLGRSHGFLTETDAALQVAPAAKP